MTVMSLNVFKKGSSRFMCYVSYTIIFENIMTFDVWFLKRRKCDTSLLEVVFLKRNFRTLILLIKQ